MKKNKAGNCLIYIGFLFVVAAIILTSYNFWDDRRAAAASGAAMEEILLDISNAKEMQEEETPDYFVAPEMEMPKSSVGEYDYIGVLDIPALGMNLPVVGELSYSALKVAPPGMIRSLPAAILVHIVRVVILEKSKDCRQEMTFSLRIWMATCFPIRWFLWKS